MNNKAKYQETMQIIKDATQMKKTSRVPFVSSDAFWRYQDAGYTLSEAVNDYKKMEHATCRYAEKYHFDSFLDVGVRNPLQFTARLGNEEYIIDDENNTLIIKEQNHFEPEDYDSYVSDPTKTLWEKVLPRKYKKFNSEMQAEDLVDFLAEFMTFHSSIGKINKALAKKCGVPPLVNAGMPITPPIETLVGFYRGFRGTGLDMRRRPEKVQAFIESSWDPAVLDSIKPIEGLDSCFSQMTSMLSTNLMSAKQFERYFWPYLKQASDRVEEVKGTYFLLSEGTTVHITEYLQQLAPKRFCLFVESDDIFERRKALPDMCLMGGIPIDLLGSGTKEQCLDHVKRVIDEVGRDGGLILAPNKFTAGASDCNPENLLAIGEYLNKTY